MNPIIDPNLFYWANVCEVISNISAVLLLVISIGAVIMGICCHIYYMEYEEVPAIIAKIGKILGIVVIILILLFIFIPTKETLYSMTAAKLITPDNIDTLVEKGEDGISFIVDQIEQIITTAKQTE